MSETSSLSRVKILVGNSEHTGACMRIGESLPEFFDEAGLNQMRRSLSSDVLYVAVEEGSVVGFATVTGGEKSEEAEITWLAVDPGRQRKGIGRSLLKRIEESLAEKCKSLLMVKTLAAEANYPPYEATRTFYEKNGFSHVETIHSYAEWGGDPAAIYSKQLSTREAGRSWRK